MKKDFLEIELRLLIQKYGYSSILRKLAVIKESSLEQIETLLCEIEQRGNRSKTKKQKSDIEVAEETIKGSANYEVLKQLALSYHNKRFLPQLKDVKRFLSQSGVDISNIKSRVLATKKVFELLKGFGRKELEELNPSYERNGETAFSALAKEIIDGHTNTPSNNAPSSDSKQ